MLDELIEAIRTALSQGELSRALTLARRLDREVRLRPAMTPSDIASVRSTIERVVAESKATRSALIARQRKSGATRRALNAYTQLNRLAS